MAVRAAGFVVDRERRPVGDVRISFRGRSVGKWGDDGSFSVGLGNAAAECP